MRFSLQASIIAMLSCLPAQAQEKPPVQPPEKIEIGHGVICDTLQQVERYVALRGNGTETNRRAAHRQRRSPRRGLQRRPGHVQCRRARRRLDGTRAASFHHADQRPRLRQRPGLDEDSRDGPLHGNRREGTDRIGHRKMPPARFVSRRGSRVSATSAACGSRPPSWPSARWRRRGRPRRRCAAAPAPTLARRRVVFRPAAPGAALLATMGFLVHRRPGAPRGLPARDSALLVALLDMLGLALLLVGVARLVTTGHRLLLLQMEFKSENASGGVQFRTCGAPTSRSPARARIAAVCARFAAARTGV